jgi:hypothetical protein
MCVVYLTKKQLAEVDRQLEQQKLRREREKDMIRVHVPKGYKLVLVPNDPPKVVPSPPLSTEEIMRLRAHIDEAKTDPDYDCIWSHQADWGADISDSNNIGYYSYEFMSCTT